MRCPTWLRLVPAALLCFAVLPADAGALADVAILDRTTGERLPVYTHDGRLYVPGTPGNRYSVELRNRTERRILAVVSVDGVNVLSGDTAAVSQAGYVLSPQQAYAIAGWRKSLDEVASFYFTPLVHSYAARTGRPANVGVIGVAVFCEQPEAPPARIEERPRERDAGDSRATPQEAGDGTLEAEPEASADATRRGSGVGQSAPAPAREAHRTIRLGTGHGERLASTVETTPFRRARATPDETLVIHYDSRANLVARGIIPRPAPERSPDPFPGRFVPDPRG
jgi:hypothetical protein